MGVRFQRKSAGMLNADTFDLYFVLLVSTFFLLLSALNPIRKSATPIVRRVPDHAAAACDIWHTHTQ